MQGVGYKRDGIAEKPRGDDKVIRNPLLFLGWRFLRGKQHNQCLGTRVSWKKLEPARRHSSFRRHYSKPRETKNLLSFHIIPNGLLPGPLINLGGCRDQSSVQRREGEHQIGGHIAQDQNRYGMGEDNRCVWRGDRQRGEGQRRLP